MISSRLIFCGTLCRNASITEMVCNAFRCRVVWGSARLSMTYRSRKSNTRVILLENGKQNMNQFTNTDTAEIKKFDDVAQIWWDPKGEMGTLHTINPLRMKFITDALNLSGCKVLDVGCGGGILTEALAKAGTQATGIDLSKESLEAAKLHATQQGLNIRSEE